MNANKLIRNGKLRFRTLIATSLIVSILASCSDEQEITTAETITAFINVNLVPMTAGVVDKMTGEGDFGTIEVGKRADLLLVNGNPLEDVSNIRDLHGVMAAGRWYSREQLEQMLEHGGNGVE